MSNSRLSLYDLNEIIEKMLPQLQDENGGFKEEENGNIGCYSTIEGLYPLLLHPQKEKYTKNIVNGLEYLLKKVKEESGRISPAPEYQDIIGDCCVDSMAYGLYVLTLARQYISRYKIKEAEPLLSDINGQIKNCIRYITENQNDDKGWPLVKDNVENFRSRTYSTALVIFSLSNCEKTDFKGNKKDDIAMIRDGVYFLSIYNRSSETGGWFFSEARDNDDEKIKELKTTPNVNLTAVVTFSLAHLLLTEFGTDPTILSLAQGGSKYIYTETFKNTLDGGNLPVKDDYEPVDYPTIKKGTVGKKIETKKYVFSYEMILPALLLSPGYSVSSRELVALRDFIYADLKNIEKKRLEAWKIYDFSDKIFALLYYYYIETLFEKSITLFAKAGDVIRCVVDDYNLCSRVIEARDICPYSNSIASCPHVSSAKSRTILQRFKNQWIAFSWWLKGLLIQLIIVVFTLPVLLYLDQSSQTPFGLRSEAMWNIYGLIQMFVTIGLQGYYGIKEKTGGGRSGQK